MILRRQVISIEIISLCFYNGNHKQEGCVADNRMYNNAQYGNSRFYSKKKWKSGQKYDLKCCIIGQNDKI